MVKPFEYILIVLLFTVGCASHSVVPSNAYFLPCAAKASVTFEGETQMGCREFHRIEVRRLAYVRHGAKEGKPTMSSCVIYYAGEEYGPYILCVLDDCIDPLAKRVSKDIVEVYFLAGAHTHFRQRWKLLGYTAQLEKQDEIDWSEDPRMKADVEHGVKVNISNAGN